MSKNCCPKCGRKLEPSDVEGYKFVCYHCDENFYEFEAIENQTDFTCPKCGNTRYFTTDEIKLVGTVYISPDGWDYFTEGGDVSFTDNSFLTCEECGYEGYPEKFEIDD